ncbi:hypothetical protein NXX53_06040 [Bacteroides salyersiae]|nr:hypothetical protein [Bacteroides salyersiae]
MRNLLRIQKIINVDSKDATIGIKDLLAHAAGNALVFGTLSSYWINQNLHYVEQMRHSFDSVYYQVDLSEYKAERIDAEVLKAVDYFFKTLYLPEFRNFVIEPILICDTYYLDKDDARNKIILNKIANGAAHKQSEDQYFKDLDEHYTTLKNLFDSDKWNIDELFKRMCSHTVDIAQRACASYDIGKMYMPQYIMLDDERVKYNTRFRMFHALLEEGLRRKIPPTLHEQYRQRLNEETYIIESTNNVDYFLIQYDMIREAKKRGIVTGIGRGSAGGSLVSYLLDIITIDPIKYGLIFSRFLVPERCGLHWVDEITAIAEDLELEPGESYIRIETDHGTLEVDKWAKAPHTPGRRNTHPLCQRPERRRRNTARQPRQALDTKRYSSMKVQKVEKLLAADKMFVADMFVVKGLIQGGHSAMPDIDTDFASDRRQEIKEYLEQRYNVNGMQRVFSAGTFSTMKLKAVLKDVSRVYRVPVSLGQLHHRHIRRRQHELDRPL